MLFIGAWCAVVAFAWSVSESLQALAPASRGVDSKIAPYMKLIDQTISSTTKLFLCLRLTLLSQLYLAPFSAETSFNMLGHNSLTRTIDQGLKLCFQCSMHTACRESTRAPKQVDGFAINDSFGPLHTFADNRCLELTTIQRNLFMLLFDFVVICSEIIPERDMVCINFSCLWMLANFFRAIITVTGWGFQLNTSITGTFCRASVDLVEFCVDSTRRNKAPTQTSLIEASR